MKIFLLLILSTVNLYANEIKIQVIPENPIYNETFEVKFIIQTDTEEEPIINFDPLGVEVVDRSNAGTTTRMTYINGVSTVERTVSIAYEMTASRPGGVFLRNIQIDLGGKTLKVPTKKIDVLKQQRSAKKVFVQAEVSKNSVFVGESIVVRYYLYNLSTVNLNVTDIKKFPKLDKFLKRFHQENSPPEKVRVNGKIYIRRIMYTAQLFAPEEGVFKIDPISLKVRYGERANPFSGFGISFSSGRSRSSTLASKVVEIEVMSLPNEGMEPHFTGLVGTHKFTMKKNKDKFIANEPIELQLSVEGNGALELFEAPRLLTDPALEEFEKTSDFQKNRNFNGTKKINYTYLGRESTSIENKVVPMSYFDPEQGKYITVNLDLGDIKVAGNISAPGESGIGKLTDNKDEPRCEPGATLEGANVNQDEKMDFGLLSKPINSFLFYTKELFFIFSSAILLLIIYLIWKGISGRAIRTVGPLDEIFEDGVSYGSLHKMLSSIPQFSNMNDAVENLSLSAPCQKYFFSLIEILNKYFSEDSLEHRLVVNKKYFKELDSAIEEAKIEKDN